MSMARLLQSLPRAALVLALLALLAHAGQAIKNKRRDLQGDLRSYDPPKCAGHLVTERGQFRVHHTHEPVLTAPGLVHLELRIRPFKSTITSFWLEDEIGEPLILVDFTDVTAEKRVDVRSSAGHELSFAYPAREIVVVRVSLDGAGMSASVAAEELFWQADGPAEEARDDSIAGASRIYRLTGWGVSKVPHPVLNMPLDEAFLEAVVVRDGGGRVLYASDFVGAPSAMPKPTVGSLYPCALPIIDDVEPVRAEDEDAALVMHGRNLGTDASLLSVELWSVEVDGTSDAGNEILRLDSREMRCTDIEVLEDDAVISCTPSGSNDAHETKFVARVTRTDRRPGESVWLDTHIIFINGAIVDSSTTVGTAGGAVFFNGSFIHPANITVTIGGVECTDATLLSNTSMTCEAAPGTGSSLEVEVVYTDFPIETLARPFPVFSYDKPTILPHDPLEWNATTIILEGTSFGNDSSLVWVEVNGLLCSDPVIVVPHTSISCTLPLDLPAGNLSVLAIVDGQWSDVAQVELEEPPVPEGPDLALDVSSLLIGARPLHGGLLLIRNAELPEGAPTPTVYLSGIEVWCSNAVYDAAANEIQCDVPPVWRIARELRDEMDIFVSVWLGGEEFGPVGPIPTEAIVPSTGNVVWYVPQPGGITWDGAAQLAAELEPHPVLGGGYLASPVDREQSTFLAEQFSGREGWIGRVFDSQEYRFEWYAGPHEGEVALFSAEADPDKATPTPALIQVDGTWKTAPRDEQILGAFVQFGSCGDRTCDEAESCIHCSRDCQDCKTNGLVMEVWYENGFSSRPWLKTLTRVPSLDGSLLPGGELPNPELWVRWSGFVQVPATATYVFELVLPGGTEGGVHMTLNGELLIGARRTGDTDVFRSVSFGVDRVHLQAIELSFWSRTFDPAGADLELRWATVDASGEISAFERIPYSHLFTMESSYAAIEEWTTPYEEGSPGAMPVPIAFSQDRALSTRSVLAYDPERWYTRTVTCEWDHFDSTADGHSQVTPQLRASCAAARYTAPASEDDVVRVAWSSNDPSQEALPSPYVGDRGVLAPLLDRNGATQVCALQQHETGPGTEWTFVLGEPTAVSNVRLYGFNVYDEVRENGTTLPWTGVTLALLAWNDTAGAWEEVAASAWASGNMEFEWEVAVDATTDKLRVAVNDTGATFTVCLSEFEVYSEVEHELASCECLNDGSWGSVCGHWGECDNPWCYVDPACTEAEQLLAGVAAGNVTTELVGDRTGRLWKQCTEAAVASTCSSALRVARSNGTFHANTLPLGDDAFAPVVCSSTEAPAPLGLRGVWFRLVGAGEELVLDTCAPETKFSSYVTVYAPSGETHCDCLECVEVSTERVLCGNNAYSSSRVTFTAAHAQWYYVFVSGGVTPFPTETFDYGKGLVGLNVHGKLSGWNDGNEYSATASAFIDVNSYYTPGLDLVCASGYEVTYTIGADGPPCEVYEDDSDSCLGQRTPTCSDIDECVTGDHTCPNEESCVNLPGTFECICTGSFYKHPTDPRSCLVATEDFTAWEVLELRRRQQLANELEHEQRLSRDATPSLEAELKQLQTESQLRTVNQLLEHDIPRLTAWVMQAELYARYADAAVPPLQGLPNIGYLGRGYDMFAANPQSVQGLDPGWRAQILDMAYNVVRLTSDARFALPDNVHAEMSPASQFESESRVISSETEMREELSKSTQVEYGGSLEVKTPYAKVTAEVAYSASSEYKSTSETLQTQETYFVQVTGKTVSYFAGLSDPAPDYLNPNFVRLVGALDPDCFFPSGSIEPDCPTASLEGYYELLDTFGTHYTTWAVFGGNAYERYEMSAYELQTTLDESASSSSTISGKGGVFSKPVKVTAFGSETSSKTKASHARSLEKSSTARRKEWYIGGEAAIGSSDSGSTDALKRWSTTVNNNPVPVQKTVSPLTRVLTEKQFPDDDAIFQKQEFLNGLLYNYCVRSGSALCGAFLPTVDVPADGIAFTDLVYLDHIVPAGVHGPGTGIDAVNDRTFRLMVDQESTSAMTQSYPGRMAEYVVDESGEATYIDSEGVEFESTTWGAVRTSDIATTKCSCDLSDASTEVEIRFYIDDDDTNSRFTITLEGFDGTETTHTSKYKASGRNRWHTLKKSIPYASDFVRTSSLPSDPLKFRNIRIALDKNGGGCKVKDFEIAVDGVRCSMPEEVNGRWDKGQTKNTGRFECEKGESYDDPCDAIYRTKLEEGSYSNCFELCTSYVLSPSSIGCVAYAEWNDGQASATKYCILFDKRASSNIKLTCESTFPSKAFTSDGFIIESSSIGIEELGGEPGAYFRLTSPIALKNDVQAAILYGSPFFLTSRFGGMAVRSDATFGGEMMEAKAGLIVNSEGDLETVDDIRYYGFRLLPVDNSRFGQPVLDGDEVIVQMIAGRYAISYDALDVILVRPVGETSGDTTATVPEYPSAYVMVTEEEVLDLANRWVISKVPISRPDAVSVINTATRPTLVVEDVEVANVENAMSVAHTIRVLLNPLDAQQEGVNRSPLLASAFNFTATAGCDDMAPIAVVDQAAPYDGSDLIMIDPVRGNLTRMSEDGVYFLRVTFAQQLAKGDCLTLRPKDVYVPGGTSPRYAYSSVFELPYIGEFVEASTIYSVLENVPMGMGMVRQLTMFFQFPAAIVNQLNQNFQLGVDVVFEAESGVDLSGCTIEKYPNRREDDAALDSYLTDLAMGSTPSAPGTQVSDSALTAAVRSYVARCQDVDEAITDVFVSFIEAPTFYFHQDDSADWDDEQAAMREDLSSRHLIFSA